MNALVSIEMRRIGAENISSVSARDLWKFIESKQHFADWIKTRLLRLKEGREFIVHKVMNGDSKGLTGTKTLFEPIEYYLTLDAAKGVAMLENNAKGDEIRQYFIDALEALAKEVRISRLQAATIKEQDELIEVQKPAQAFVDKFVETKGLLGLRMTGKALGLGQTEFITRCEKAGVIFRERGRWTAYSKWIDAGYMTTKSGMTDDAKVAYSQPLFMMKGIIWVAKLLGLTVDPKALPEPK